jgi:hypothetical protein
MNATQILSGELVQSGLHENSPEKWLTAVGIVGMAVVSACLSAATIWYDYFGTDNYKTMIHLLSTQVSWRGTV